MADQFVLLTQGVERLGGAVEQIDRARDAVHREVGVHRGQHQGTAGLGGIELDAQIVARTEDVVLLDRAGQREALLAGVAGTDHDVAGRALGHGQGHIDLIGGTGHLGGVDIDVLEITQAFHAIARGLDLGAVVPGGFELAEFAADHFVAGAGVARDDDAAHIDAALRLGREGHHHLPGCPVDLGTAVDTRKRVAEGAVEIGEGTRGGSHSLTPIRLAGLEGDQALEVLLTPEEVPLELDGGDGVGLPLVDRDGDADALLVRRDRHLRGGDGKLQIAAIQVVGAQGLQVGIELGARVAVGLGVPGQPTAGGLLEQAGQRALGKDLVAQNADFTDFGRLTLGHLEADVDAIAFQRGDGGGDLGAVKAAGQVLALEFLLGTVSQRLVEGLALADTHILERLGQCLGIKLLETDEAHRRNDGALLDHDDSRVTIDLDAHILEQAGGEQGADRGRTLLLVVGLPDAERQRGEHGTGVGALQALDTDVLEYEGIDGPGRAGL